MANFEAFRWNFSSSTNAEIGRSVYLVTLHAMNGAGFYNDVVFFPLLMLIGLRISLIKWSVFFLFPKAFTWCRKKPKIGSHNFFVVIFLKKKKWRVHLQLVKNNSQFFKQPVHSFSHKSLDKNLWKDITLSGVWFFSSSSSFLKVININE